VYADSLLSFEATESWATSTVAIYSAFEPGSAVTSNLIVTRKRLERAISPDLHAQRMIVELAQSSESFDVVHVGPRTVGGVPASDVRFVRRHEGTLIEQRVVAVVALEPTPAQLPTLVTFTATSQRDDGCVRRLGDVLERVLATVRFRTAQQSARAAPVAPAATPFALPDFDLPVPGRGQARP
jgi:hypothetical protein